MRCSNTEHFWESLSLHNGSTMRKIAAHLPCNATTPALPHYSSNVSRSHNHIRSPVRDTRHLRPRYTAANDIAAGEKRPLGVSACRCQVVRSSHKPRPPATA
ncbi:hypothetical protein PsYK624_121430 [Phanerochaete sordida]|uniref:Uncharacterized protein n=1 Tax=Phanerochaete sordida TaxID=48140 RepID=A0A9P3LHW6_9APHY|nr:hypothetical protein PsYK624_121430 [Phanerochaete sordida]